MKILNLYAGIGGNRKLWGDEHKITAVENDPKIAKIYQEFFPILDYAINPIETQGKLLWKNYQINKRELELESVALK